MLMFGIWNIQYTYGVLTDKLPFQTSGVTSSPSQDYKGDPGVSVTNWPHTLVQLFQWAGVGSWSIW